MGRTVAGARPARKVPEPGTRVERFGNSIQEDDMTDDPKTEPQGNAIKDPDDWTTGEEPMTGAQASYLKTLSEEAGEPFDDSLSKGDASKRIDELQGKTGRGDAA
jgi:hypothetical protein